MKIRQGFVSNSSSSSFAIIYRPIGINGITKSQIRSGKIWVLGKWLGDGQDVMKMNKELFKEFKKIYEKFDGDINNFDGFEILEVIVNGDENNAKINRNDLPEGDLTLKNVEMDHHSTSNVEQLRELYSSEGDKDED